MARSRTDRIRAPQRLVVPRTPRRLAVPRGTSPQLQTKRRAPSRIVVPKRTTLPKAAARLPRLKLQATRRVPTNPALVNKGLRRNPGWRKPAGIEHHAHRKAGKSGWMHRHRPFYFKHGGKRWRRHYYTVLVGGLWYWYWYDLLADADPAAADYEEVILPECDPDSDECVEPELIAPALLEGRATQEDIDRCAAEFVSFKRETGTYVTFQGQVRVCPYLE
jgi:hypothetical protein